MDGKEPKTFGGHRGNSMESLIFWGGLQTIGLYICCQCSLAVLSFRDSCKPLLVGQVGKV